MSSPRWTRRQGQALRQGVTHGEWNSIILEKQSTLFYQRKQNRGSNERGLRLSVHVDLEDDRELFASPQLAANKVRLAQQPPQSPPYWESRQYNYEKFWEVRGRWRKAKTGCCCCCFPWAPGWKHGDLSGHGGVIFRIIISLNWDGMCLDRLEFCLVMCASAEPRWMCMHGGKPWRGRGMGEL